MRSALLLIAAFALPAYGSDGYFATTPDKPESAKGGCGTNQVMACTIECGSPKWLDQGVQACTIVECHCQEAKEKRAPSVLVILGAKPMLGIPQPKN